VAGDTSVFWADLDAHPGLAHLLSADELARAARFRRAVDRDRYVAARGLLRRLLAERAPQSPAEIRLEIGPQGKPALADPGGVAFNISHSGRDALFAFSTEGQVGVDLERVRPLDPLALAASCFSVAERAELGELPAARRLGAFFDGWVRKEAVIKADGRGVSLGLDRFSVALAGDARLLEPPPGDEPEAWTLRHLDLQPGLRGALAVRC
jgi:4'-phosphopantetheinyl transferase